MITFTHRMTGQIVEIANDLRTWFLSTVSDAEHWIDHDAPVAEPVESGEAPAQKILPEITNDAI